MSVRYFRLTAKIKRPATSAKAI